MFCYFLLHLFEYFSCFVESEPTGPGCGRDYGKKEAHFENIYVFFQLSDKKPRYDNQNKTAEYRPH